MRFLLASCRSMTKIAGSGSIGQRHGSANPDPDPPQNVMDPQNWLKETANENIPVAKLVACLLATAALSGFESRQLSKIPRGHHKQTSGQYTLACQKIYKKYLVIVS